MKSDKFIDRYVKCTMCNKSYQMVKGKDICPACGSIIDEDADNCGFYVKGLSIESKEVIK